MTSRLRIVATFLWTAFAVAPTTLAQGATGVATTRGPLTREPVRTVDAVDLTRYVGEWFEVARFPNRFQRQCVSDVRATYTQRPDGRIDVINRCLTEDGSVTEARGVARVTDDRTFAQLKVRFAPAVLSFLPFVWGDYWILGLASDYSWATVGSPDRNYLWILARSPSPDAESYASALAAARSNGFDVERLTKTIHTGASSGDTDRIPASLSTGATGSEAPTHHSRELSFVSPCGQREPGRPIQEAVETGQTPDSADTPTIRIVEGGLPGSLTMV